MLENELSPTINSDTIYLKDYQEPEYLIPTVALNFSLGEEFSNVVSVLTITRNKKDKTPLILNGEKLTLIKAFRIRKV